MCKSAREGGKRCEYADMIANVRKKALYKHRDEQWVAEKRAEEAVNAWKESNPEIVRAHLPAKMPFHYTPKNPLPIPKELMGMLTPSSRIPIIGAGSKEERKERVKAMFDSHKEWAERLNEDESRAVAQYVMTAYTTMNALLRKKGFSRIMKADYKGREEKADEIRERAKERVEHLKAALKKSVPAGEPRKLYRFFRVPPGITPKEYVERYLTTGEGFKDPAFMSTSSDPEYVMAHIHDRNGSTTNKHYVVMEILTKQGQSLQKTDEPDPGDVQSLESEVLLPAGTKLRVAGFNKSQRFEYGSERRDLFSRYGGNFGNSEYDFLYNNHHCKGDRLNIPTVQLVDERLIKEYAQK